jgi:ABC-type Fe3+-hydroxamate transport system substrate-binding protein
MITFAANLEIKQGMIHITDQMGNKLVLKVPAQRIVSLVPSQTALLFDLKAGQQVAGITRFCIHPAEKVRGKVKIGGTKTLNLDRIRALQPDLIIGNKEENVKEQIGILQQEFPVYLSDVNTIDDALQMIEHLGILSGTEVKAAETIDAIGKGLAELELDTAGRPPISAVYLIWENPLMGVGSDNFIAEMMKKAGLVNLLGSKSTGEQIQRYPATDIEEIKALNPELLLLSTEPFPFGEKHLEKYRAMLPGIRIEQADGEMFSWYGSSMLKAIPYLRTKLSSWHSTGQ